MKKLLFYALIIAATVLSTILLIAFLMPKKIIPNYSDEKLRELALSKGLKPVPSSYEELLKLVDDVKNPMTPQKIALGSELFFDTNLSKNRKTSCATCHSFDKDIQNRGALLSTLMTKNPEITNCAACHLRDQSGVDRFTFAEGDSG
ncbi:MAG: cytochrome c peroxidase, partial [Sulfurimonas sp.]|nr:cytochrome c peroxidase [Sulfurimonas sp.]